MKGSPKIVPIPISDPVSPILENMAIKMTISSGNDVNRGDNIAPTKELPSFR
jgi:hypothetical protein